MVKSDRATNLCSHIISCTFVSIIVLRRILKYRNLLLVFNLTILKNFYTQIINPFEDGWQHYFAFYVSETTIYPLVIVRLRCVDCVSFRGSTSSTTLIISPFMVGSREESITKLPPSNFSYNVIILLDPNDIWTSRNILMIVNSLKKYGSTQEIIKQTQTLIVRD